MKSISVILLLLVSVAVLAQRKSVSILGDSYSTFEEFLTPDTNEVWYYKVPDLKRTDVSSVNQTWWHMLINEMGWKLCVNNSYSGSTISSHGYRHEDYTTRSFVTRLTNLGCPDIIFIFGGTNDSWAGASVGEYKYGDWTVEDLKTYRPSLAKLLNDVKLHYPNVDVYFILNSELREDINESTRSLCSHYGIKLIELTNISKQRSHPNREGMRAIADQVKLFLEKN